jgi:uncharacterized caspase-like protein
MRRLTAIVLVLFGLAVFAASAAAEKRVALVIGNSAYKTVGLLANPANDATAMAALLKSAGFAVTELRDAGLADFQRAVSDFSDTASDADIAVFYFAGHGIEVDRANYLIPTDARLVRDFDVGYETVALDRVLQAIEPAKRLRLVILDACRTNPFIGNMRRSNRSVGRGLVRVDPAAADTLVAFAAKENTVADDGAGTHSPFTAALLKHLTTPGLDIRIALGKVRDEVRTATQRKQEPFVYGSLGGQNVAIVSAPATATPSQPSAAPAAPTDPDAAARRDYELAAQVGTTEAWDAFLARHPSGYYADLARSARGKLAVVAPPVIPVPPPWVRKEEDLVKTTLGKAINGTLTLTIRSRRTINYEVTHTGNEDGVVVVEEGRAEGWTLLGYSKDVEETPTRFLYRIAAAKGQATKASLVLERVDSEIIVLATLAPEEMLSKISGLQNESPKLKETIARLDVIVDAITKIKARQSELENERRRILGDQERIHANLDVVGRASDLGRRYLRSLKVQQDRLAEISRLKVLHEGEIASRVRSAEELARGLTF